MGRSEAPASLGGTCEMILLPVPRFVGGTSRVPTSLGFSTSVLNPYDRDSGVPCPTD